MPGLMPFPPLSPCESVTEILHGIPVTDPYRWLEDQHSPRTRGWIDEQTAYTRAYLDAIPDRERIRKRVEELLAVDVISEPWKVRNRYFYLRRIAHKQQPVIMMREGETGEEIPLVDPANRDATGATAVNILSISPDAKFIAFGVRDGGEDSCAVEFVDVGTIRCLPDRLTRGFCRGLAFDPNGTGFYYSHDLVGTSRTSRRAVLRHAFGTATHEDKELFVGGDDPKLKLILLCSPSCTRLGYYKLFATDPRKIDFLIQDLVADTPARSIVENLECLFAPFLLDDQLLALTDWQAPNRRIVKIDLAHPEQENWLDIVPESDSCIHALAVAGERIFVNSVTNLSTCIDLFDFSGKKRDSLRLPAMGTASLFPCRPDTDTVFYRFTSFAHPPSLLCRSARTGNQQIWVESSVTFDPSSIEIERIHYLSKDGTPVPMFMVSQRGRRSVAPMPTFLTGYGGFGTSITPAFTAYATYLMERGCLFAVANLRGGGEFGEAWHLSAKRQKRQVAIDDFISAAEWLLQEGYAMPGRLAIGGGSNAGLLVGAALTQRPDLFRAVICLGPLLDMLRYHRFDLAHTWIDEYGCAEIESDFRALLQYSPYHRVENGAAYPAVMLISGDADTRCNPMHARKMAARLQAATTSEHPILLDYKPVWGHTPIQPLTKRIDALTDRLAFLCQELGLHV
jgi:prolyl oligopeptidase